MSTVSDLERIFLPLLEVAKREVALEQPQFRYSVGSSSVGSRTEHQGHRVWLECLFPEAADDEADSVAILVGVKHINTRPLLCEASVEWGSGTHPDIGVELQELPIAITEQTLQQIAGRLPELMEVFRGALKARASGQCDA